MPRAAWRALPPGPRATSRWHGLPGRGARASWTARPSRGRQPPPRRSHRHTPGSAPWRSLA
ncbi:hypothetical protein FRC75_12580 [Paracidovorax citrulli]|nr:hypothetical protein FRC75_12580 [Paracidovorax citrulli]